MPEISNNHTEGTEPTPRPRRGRTMVVGSLALVAAVGVGVLVHGSDDSTPAPRGSLPTASAESFQAPPEGYHDNILLPKEVPGRLVDANTLPDVIRARLASALEGDVTAELPRQHESVNGEMGGTNYAFIMLGNLSAPDVGATETDVHPGASVGMAQNEMGLYATYGTASQVADGTAPYIPVDVSEISPAILVPLSFIDDNRGNDDQAVTLYRGAFVQQGDETVGLSDVVLQLSVKTGTDPAGVPHIESVDRIPTTEPKDRVGVIGTVPVPVS